MTILLDIFLLMHIHIHPFYLLSIRLLTQVPLFKLSIHTLSPAFLIKSNLNILIIVYS